MFNVKHIHQSSLWTCSLLHLDIQMQSQKLIMIFNSKHFPWLKSSLTYQNSVFHFLAEEDSVQRKHKKNEKKSEIVIVIIIGK